MDAVGQVELVEGCAKVGANQEHAQGGHKRLGEEEPAEPVSAGHGEAREMAGEAEERQGAGCRREREQDGR